MHPALCTISSSVQEWGTSYNVPVKKKGSRSDSYLPLFLRQILSSLTIAQTLGLSRSLQFSWLTSGHSEYCLDIILFRYSLITVVYSNNGDGHDFLFFFLIYLNIWISRSSWHPVAGHPRFADLFPCGYPSPSLWTFQTRWSRHFLRRPVYSWCFPGGLPASLRFEWL